MFLYASSKSVNISLQEIFASHICELFTHSIGKLVVLSNGKNGTIESFIKYLTISISRFLPQKSQCFQYYSDDKTAFYRLFIPSQS